MALNLRLSRIICSINSFSSMVKISATIAITSIMIDQIFSTTVSSCTPSYISANNPPMVSSPCSSGAQAWIRNTLPCVFGLAVSVTLAVVAPLALPGRKTLFLAIDLPSRRESRSPRQIESGRRSSTGPAACSRECTAETRARISCQYTPSSIRSSAGRNHPQ